MTANEYKSHRSEKNARPLAPVLLKIKNTLKFGRRWSSNPQKQLCFTWLASVLRRSKEFNTTLDVACGNLNNYPFVRSANYIGVDMNQASLDYGERVYPKAQTARYLIEELGGSGLTGDLVLCTQTIGVNSYFKSENTMPNVMTLVACTNPNGTLTFDTGVESFAYVEEIEILLREQFDQVDVKAFGSYDKSSNMLASIFVAALMQLLPSMRTRENATRRFYVCDGKY